MPIGFLKSSKGEMPFLDHLEELRWRILWSLLAIGIGAGVGIFLVIRFDVIGLLTGPLFTIVTEIQAENPEFMGGLPAGRLFFLDLMEPFFFTLKLGIITGLLLVFPILAYQVWAFLSPALEKREKRVIIPSLYFGLVLFMAGVAMRLDITFVYVWRKVIRLDNFVFHDIALRILTRRNSDLFLGRPNVLNFVYDVRT